MVKHDVCGNLEIFSLKVFAVYGMCGIVHMSVVPVVNLVWSYKSDWIGMMTGLLHAYIFLYTYAMKSRTQVLYAILYELDSECE